MILNMDDKVGGCTTSLSVLSKLWENPCEDEGFYGPYGIREFMTRKGANPCLGELPRR